MVFSYLIQNIFILKPSAVIDSSTLRHYTCSAFCKTTYHLLISPPPTNLPNRLKIHTGENQSIHAIFQLTVRRIRIFFQPKTFCIQRGIIPQNFSLLGFAVSEELGNNQTNTQTHSLTGLALLQSDSLFFLLFFFVSMQYVFMPCKKYQNSPKNC